MYKFSHLGFCSTVCLLYSIQYLVQWPQWPGAPPQHRWRQCTQSNLHPQWTVTEEQGTPRTDSWTEKINCLSFDTFYSWVSCDARMLCIHSGSSHSLYLYTPGSWLISSGVPFLFQDTLGGGIPVISQLSTALIPVVTVTLNGPGLIEGPTAGDRTALATAVQSISGFKHDKLR